VERRHQGVDWGRSLLHQEKGKIVDRGAEQIAQDMKAITETRLAIAERLSQIEQHVGTTMQHARTMMTHLEDSTTSAVRDTMQVTKEAFDPKIQAERHPWAFVGGALVLGYAVGTLYYHDARRIPSGVIPYYPPSTKGAAVMPTNGAPTSEHTESGVYPFYPHGAIDDRGREQGRAGRPTLWVELEQGLHDELADIRNGAIRFGRGLLRDLISHAVPALAQIIGNPHDGDRSKRDPARR
jgi:hypothetical protein